MLELPGHGQSHFLERDAHVVRTIIALLVELDRVTILARLVLVVTTLLEHGSFIRNSLIEVGDCVCLVGEYI